MNTIIIAIAFCLIFIGTAFSQANGWQDIIPLRSTKNDVEKLLGKPYKKEINLYDTERERVAVWYSDGKCKGKKSSYWDVPKNTVLGLLVSPKQSLSIKTFTEKLNQRFERYEDWEIKGIFHYFNKDGSIKFETLTLPNGEEDVKYTVYRPTENDIKLRCKQ